MSRAEAELNHNITTNPGSSIQLEFGDFSYTLIAKLHWDETAIVPRAHGMVVMTIQYLRERMQGRGGERDVLLSFILMQVLWHRFEGEDEDQKLCFSLALHLQQARKQTTI